MITVWRLPQSQAETRVHRGPGRTSLRGPTAANTFAGARRSTKEYGSVALGSAALGSAAPSLALELSSHADWGKPPSCAQP